MSIIMLLMQMAQMLKIISMKTHAGSAPSVADQKRLPVAEMVNPCDISHTLTFSTFLYENLP